MVNFIWENFHRVADRKKNIEALLADNALFSGLRSRELKIIREMVHERHYRSGERVFKEGEIGIGMYIVVRGGVTITTQNLDVLAGAEPETIVTHLQEGDFFGEVSLVEQNGHRSASAWASKDSILLGFFKPDLMALIERHPAIGVKVVFRLAEVLGRRLRETTEKITSLKMDLKRSKDPSTSA
ncbi:MAG: hypothetical protein COT74_04645 [Bdellovibrionales bacterium CG10_big_fil_rev_8_21_14_0_10_45_34]|nr:MAG: hypothetical protein COT74_04645 [Bdellovibrionales bacterium CG10_big_fil_rev_8_21_14_0_10_45_34]